MPDQCRVLDVDGEPVRVRGAGELTPEAQLAIAEVVRAARAQMLLEQDDQVAWWTEIVASIAAEGGRAWPLHLGIRAPLSLNGSRRHPMVHARGVKYFRHLAWARAREAKIPRLDRVSCELHYAPRDQRRRDRLNLVATLKPVEDGIVDAGVIPDDTEEYSVPTMPVIDAPTGRLGQLYVIVREVVA